MIRATVDATDETPTEAAEEEGDEIARQCDGIRQVEVHLETPQEVSEVTGPHEDHQAATMGQDQATPEKVIGTVRLCF